MKSKEKMVLSTEKKSKTTKKDIPKQPRKLNSSSIAKKCIKKEPKEKILFSLIDKSSEDFNDSLDFISPQDRRKHLKNEKNPTEPSSATSKEPKKRTYQRRLSSSSSDPAPLSAIETSTRRRTRSSERKIQEAERNGESLTDNLDLSKNSPALPSISGASVKGTSASKPTRCSSQELKKQTSHTPKLSKVKVEPPEKDEKSRRTPAKKVAKSEQVKSNAGSSSSTCKEGTVPVVGKDKPPTKKQTSRSRLKSSETSDTLNLSEKSSPKVDTPGGKKVKKRNLDKDSPKTPAVKLEPSRKRAQRSSSTSSKYAPRKKEEKERDVSENNDSSQMLLTAATKKCTPKVQSSTDSKESSSSAVNAGQNSTVKCPTCKDLIPEEGLGRHILMCLKNKYQAGAKSQHPALPGREQLLKDEILARQIHENMNRDMLSSKESVGTEDLTFCHVCQKDLSRMNNSWKTRHMNLCFDNAEGENVRKTKKLAATVRQQVPACPMCGKQFKTGALRRCHLKKCAQELSISPEKALKLIAEQEKNVKQSQPATAAAASSSTSARSVRNKLNKLPDEQMQVAMAMSSSLFEEQKKLNEQLAETVKNIHQGVNRELRKLKKSKRKTPESVPLLLTVSKEDQLARNAQRVDSIISEPAHTVHFPRQFPYSSLSRSCRDVYQMSENSNNSLAPPSFWSRASLTDSSLAPNLFYVQSLMPPIQVDKVTVGSRLKPLSAIPGRGLDKEETDSVSDNLPDAPAVPSTQTAVLLAEMAQSNEEDLDDEESSGSTIVQTQGFYLSWETDDTPGTHENKALTALSEDLCKLVNTPHLSDIEFVAADSSRVFAHRLLLSVRCPQILSLAVSKENHLVIEMKDISHNSLLAFLRYLYAGRVDFEKNVTADLLQLSRRFNLPQLALICEKTLQALIDEACYTPSVESVAGDIPEPLEIGDNQLQENEDDDDGMTVDNNSVEPYKGDILAGIKEPPSEKLICEKRLQALIDEACYTPSVESVAGDIPEPLEIGDNQLQENENDNDDGMAVDNNSVEPYKADILSEIKEPPSEKLICEKRLQALIDGACYTPSVESVAGDIPEPLEIGDNQLQENEEDDDDDGMAVDNNSVEPYKGDILAGIKKPPSEKLICEKTLQALIDGACYTLSVESVAGDIPEPLEIGDNQLQENEEDDDGMTVDNNSVEPYKGDILAEIKEQPSEKLHSLPEMSPLKSSCGTVLHFSTEHSDQKLPTVIPVKIFATIMDPSGVEFSPERQNKGKVPIPVCDALTDCSISVIEEAAKLVNKMSPSSNDAPTYQDVTYKKSKSISLELNEEIGAKGRCSDTISEQNMSSLTQQVSVFQEELENKELVAALISSDTESDRMPTSFRGLLSGKHLDRRSNNDDSVSPSVSRSSQDPGFTDVPSGTVSQEDRNHSNNALLPMHRQEEEDKLCEENSLNPNSISGAMFDYEFDDSNELFSEPEDVGEESENVRVCEVNRKELKTKAELIDECMEISSDSICFVSESQQNIHGAGMSSTVLHLADTVCENSADEDLVSGNAPFKTVSPASQPQVLISNCTILNGSTANFHMADTILEVSKNIKDSLDPLYMTAGSPLSVTVLEGLMEAPTLMQGSVSKSCMSAKNLKKFSPSSLSNRLDSTNQNSRTDSEGLMEAPTLMQGYVSKSCMSAKNLKKFSPSSLSDRFDSANQNSRTDSDSELEVKELPSELSTSPKFSYSPITSCRSNPGVRNLLNLHEDSSNVLSHSQQRRKRKSCNSDLSPSPKRSHQKKPNVHDIDSETSESGLKDYFTAAHFNKETSLEFSSFKEKSNVDRVAVDNLSNLVSTGSYLPSESTVITSNLDKDSPEKLLNKNQTKNVEEWLEIADDNSRCDVEVCLSNSPDSVLDSNLDTFSRLSEDSVAEDKSDRCMKVCVSLEQDSDLEVEPDSKNGASFDAHLERNPDCLPGSSSPKTLDLPKKKFTFKKIQLKNLKSPVICASVCSSLPFAGHTSAKMEHSPQKYSRHLRSPSEGQGHLSDRVESDCEYQPDVWDDFEDNGHMEDFVLTSPAEHIGAKKLDCKDNSNSDSPRTSEVSDEIANNEAFNSSFINDFICSSSPVMSQTEESPHFGDLQPSPYTSLSVVDAQSNSDEASHNAKTPLSAIRRRGRKALTIPSPFTPMPLYTQMTTPELKKEMKKHGCKRMNRKKMVTVLQDIYQRTHQYESDSDLNQSTLHLEVSPKTQPGDLEIVGLQTRSKTQDGFLCTHNEKISPVAVKTMSKKPDSKMSVKDKSPVKDGVVSAQMPNSEFTNLVDLVSDESDAVGVYEESFMANEDDDIPCSQQQMSGSCDNLHDKLRELVQKSPEIYTKMLLYEPIDFDQLKKKISESKIKCSAAKLLSFLDNQCITFAMNREKQHHGTWKPRVRRK